MSTSGSPKITFPTGDSPSRERIEAAGVRPLKIGGPTKADLLVADLGDGPMVIKDFAGKRAWVRWIGRLQIRREYLAYRWLGPVEGVPRLIGRVDAHALAIELVEGARQLGHASASALRRERGRELFARLGEVVRRFHAAGLVHWDLRTRDNVIVDGEGRLFVIDFASAFWLRPGGLAHRLLFRRMRQVDVAALLKWQRALDAGPYSEEEEAFLRRFRFWRSLWVLNPKPPRGLKRPGAGGGTRE